MRDPARIDRMIELLRKRWHEQPDQRLGQLVGNFAEKCNPFPAFTGHDRICQNRPSVDARLVEDNHMERVLELGWPKR